MKGILDIQRFREYFDGTNHETGSTKAKLQRADASAKTKQTKQTKTKQTESTSDKVKHCSY